ncbi:BQ2448_5755 [Microbotryum intermedium]|uniref:BQ2448_5755 protein n=1 Tax=Microbotryum intermedium TaxID=269621 RepID=A0A238F312_9BASI|nr:BQ2448_5755 [Microbotryum intermedium]
MTVTSLSLPGRIQSSFRSAVASKQINLFESSEVVRIDDAPPTFANQLVHICPDLASKPSVPPRTPDLSKVGKRDPLQGPIYGPGEKVQDFECGGVTYSIVHNLHALMEEHGMIIPHFGDSSPFRPQTSDLIDSDLETAYSLTRQYAGDGREIICFFNGGPLAGASQPHLHIQFCPFQLSTPPAPELLARAMASVPGDKPRKLNIPWIHYVIPIPPAPTTSQLSTLYHCLLKTNRDHLETHGKSNRTSYNFFLTQRFMHLVPRSKRLIRLESQNSDGETKEVNLSVNGLVILGLWHVQDENTRSRLLQYGLERALSECCVANEDYAAAN